MRRSRGLARTPFEHRLTFLQENEYIPTIHSAHGTIQMLLELHSKINIFTQKKKGINNLWKKSLQIQSSYYSALILSFHCTSLSIIFLSQPHPARLSHKGTSNRLPDSKCHTMSFRKGEGTTARWRLEAHPNTQTGAWRSHPGPHSSPLGHRFEKNKTKITWTLDVFVLRKMGH